MTFSTKPMYSHGIFNMLRQCLVNWIIGLHLKVPIKINRLAGCNEKPSFNWNGFLPVIYGQFEIEHLNKWMINIWFGLIIAHVFKHSLKEIWDVSRHASIVYYVRFGYFNVKYFHANIVKINQMAINPKIRSKQIKYVEEPLFALSVKFNCRMQYKPRS